MKRRLLAGILCLALLVSVLPGARASGLISFVGVNDSIPISLSAGEAPFYSGGMLYIPYTAFGASPNGVVISHDSQENTLVLFTRTSRLIYDLDAGTVTDENETVKKVTVSYKNGILFIPAVQAASHFGLSVSLLTSKTGCHVIRFTNGQQVYSNDDFISKAETLINFYLEYDARQQIEQEQNPNPETPSQEEVPPEELGPVSVYLALSGAAVSRQTLDYLEQHEMKASFFLTEEQFVQEKDLVRSIYAAGHSVGLTVAVGETDVEAALSQANAAMDKALFCKTTLALLPEGLWESDTYQLLLEQTHGVSLDQLLTQEQPLPRLLVCRENVQQTVGTLLQSGAVFLQILETTRLTQ